MARQRNRRIHFQSGFFGSFDAPWSEISWINLSSKETQNPFSDFFGFKNPILDFLKETHAWFDCKCVSKRLATKMTLTTFSSNLSARPSTSPDQRLSKLDTRFSRFSRHVLASIFERCEMLGTRELVSISWSLFQCFKTLLWWIKFSSHSLLLCARSQAVYGGIHPVKTSMHTEVRINNNR